MSFHPIDNELSVHINEIRRQAIIEGCVHVALLDDPDVGPALSRFLLYSRQLTKAGSDLDPTTAFYNAYYWFLKFKKAYTHKNGYDAGIEQQAFKLLEEASIDIDWSVIEEIEKSIVADKDG